MKTVKVVPDPERDPKHRSRKNTKRWCGGHPGREHDYRWVDVQTLPNRGGLFSWRRNERLVREASVCAACGRYEGKGRTRCAHCGLVVSERGY